METVFFKGTPCHTYGNIPAAGSTAPCFKLVSKDLADISCKDYDGKRIVLNVFPSLDTPVCAASVRCVSMDLPFAMSRFCTAEGIENVTAASAFRSPEFAQQYGLQLIDGPLAGLLARAVIVMDENHKVIFSDLVEEITNEPDYEGAISVVR